MYADTVLKEAGLICLKHCSTTSLPSLKPSDCSQNELVAVTCLFLC